VIPLILVHGGAHGAWCWDPLLPLLRTPACAVDLPPVSIRRGPTRHVLPPEAEGLRLEDWAAAVLAAADARGIDRFVLAGHSLGGLTICETARRAPDRVAHLVFVSAMVPPEGKHTVDALPADMIERMATGLGDDTLREMFCSDMDDAGTAFVLEHLGTEVGSIMVEQVTRADLDATISKTYVRLRRDRGLPPEAQDASIAALRAVPGGSVEIVELDTGHDVMISRPDVLAPVLDAIAAATS